MHKVGYPLTATQAQMTPFQRAWVLAALPDLEQRMKEALKPEQTTKKTNADILRERREERKKTRG